MSKTITVYAPNPAADGARAGFSFHEGRAEVDAENERALAYFRRRGYGIGKPAAAAKSEAKDRPAVDPIVPLAELRDAAVDPKPDDFLPPINAGKANPHGPLVVAPGIHALESKPIHPGVVGVGQPELQQAQETALAEAVYVEGQPVPEATAAAADRAGEEQGRPAAKASKSAWVDYAVAQGWSRAEAEDLSKADLQGRLG